MSIDSRHVTAEENLRKEKALSDAMLSSLPGVFYTFDQQGRFLRWNKNLEHVSGYSANEIQQMHPLEFIAEQHKSLVAEKIQEVFANGQASVEAAIRAKDGSETSFFWTGVRREIEGKLCLLGMGLDISERKRAEERIRRVNRLKEDLLGPGGLREKMSRITDGVVQIFGADFARIWIVRPGDLCDLGCFHARAVEAQHFCRRRDNCLHLIASSGRYTHIDGEVHRRVPLECYKIGRIASGDVPQFLSNDVSHEPSIHDHDWAKRLGLVSFAGYRLLSANGKPIGVMALFSKKTIAIDETALLETVATAAAQVIQTTDVQEALQFTQFSIDKAAEAVYWIDSEARFVYVNDAACRQLGYSREELLLMTVHDIAPDCPKDFWPAVWKRLQRDRFLLQQTRHRAKDGTLFPVEVNANYIEFGGKAYNCASVRDVTERKQAEQERENLIQKLGAQNAELERFAYTVSHDLKSPLITISGYAGLLEQDLAAGRSERFKDDLSCITGAAEKMNALLREVLELSRIGRQVNPSEEVALTDLATEAAELVHGGISEKRVELRISPDLPVLYGDRSRLREVLQNLIENAVKYMGDQPQPRIEIGSRQAGDEVLCFVRDNGLGIDSSYHTKIFGLFDKLDSRSEGVGIGLALAKRIVEVHGGRIWVESEGVGHGSAFCFTIPPKQ